MSYQVIARKWRPQTFDEVVGQEHVTTTLKNSIATGRVGHAYLFTGIRGVGKTTAARILAKALNCERGPTAEPCNKCSACLEITNGSSMDVTEVDGASNRGIDSIRDLREAVAFASSRDRHKIYIIDEVHMLTTEAFNALLKTLEEPPAHVIFIFATTELHKVPATIASRCQVFEFRRIALPALVVHLGMIAKAEGITVSEDALRLIAREADGSLRDACSLMDQVISFAGANIEADAVGQILRTGTRGAVERLLRGILAEDPAEALRAYADIIGRGMPARQLLKDLARFLSECIRVALLGRDAARETGLTEGEISGMADLVGGRPVEALAALLNVLVIASDRAADSRSPELLAEAALIRASRLSSMASVDGMIARLEAVARGAPMASQGASAGAPPPRSYAPSAPSAPSAPPARPAAAYPQAAPPRPAPSPAVPHVASPPGSAMGAMERLKTMGAGGAASPSPAAPATPVSTPPAAASPAPSPAPAEDDPGPRAAPRRTEAETVDLFMKDPLFNKVLGTFGGDIRKVTPE
jgi:DNA polymerase-3 subunit gamma/tau